LNRTLNLHPDFTPAWKYKAFVLSFLHRFDEAEEAFVGWGRSEGIDPEIARTLGSLVSSFGRTGVPGRLPPVFDTLRGLSPGDPARLAILVGDYEKALEVFFPGEEESQVEGLAPTQDPIMNLLRPDPRFRALTEGTNGCSPP
jgi:hypothetical protein